MTDPHLEAGPGRAGAAPRTAALLDHLARRMRVRGESAMAPLGLRPRHLVTLTLLRDGGAVPQQALAATLRIDRTNLVGLLNELEADGLVERRRSPEDRRRHVVALTGEGADRLAAAEDALGAAEDEVLGALGPDDRETLAALLRRAAQDAHDDCTADGGDGACAPTVDHVCTEAPDDAPGPAC